ncbi:hypothetical protein AM587_10013509 [Phytophthora nicotianae]|uniref:Uncharacterized protein n=1 Tax=Phytophthora nicotianae TaxID=4792 RepID=A0A0W8DWE9_PHYNI|nr:hypothetical protein AM587_10013509 [Phytophthora nicotianae]
MFGIDTDSDPEDDPEQEERSSQEDEEDADEEESTYGTKKKLKMKTVPVRVEMEILKTAELLLRVMMGPYEPKGKGKRNHNNVRDTNCPTRVNLTVIASISGRWYLRANASGSHNHAVSKHTYEGYAENRTVKDSQLKSDVAVLRKAGATAKGILQYLRERTALKHMLDAKQREVDTLQSERKALQQENAVLLEDKNKLFEINRDLLSKLFPQ